MHSSTIGNYQLIKKLATGGMAEVWLARQTGIEGFERHVVVKRILPHLSEDEEFVQMFLNEARIASRFSHPNIAQIFNLGESSGQYFISMEFIHGEDLGRVMRKAWTTGQWVARPIAMRMVADACAGLYYAHTRTDNQAKPLNVVHRDISPQNILISFDGSVKLVDFGIAKAADQVSMTKSGAIKGKFAYMAPEQAAGKPLDARTDVFALGLVLYELITGVRPLKRDSELATLQAALECKIDPPSAVAEVPPDLDPVVMAALAKDPESRYRDARQFQMALEQYLVQQGTVATSVQVSELMETLFADRLAEEAKLGSPNPTTASSTTNPLPPESYAPPEPPPPPVQAKPRAPAPSQTRDADDDESTLGADQPSVGDFELPAGTVMPSRKYLKGGEATSFGRTGSRAEATRAADPDDLGPARRRNSRPSETSDEDPPEPEPERPRRRTSAGLKKRTSSSVDMPAAPPRRTGKIARSKSRASQPSLADEPPGGTDAGLSKYVDVRALKSGQASRLRLLFVAVVFAGLVAAAFFFRESIRSVLTAGGLKDGTPVRLFITTQPSTEVLIIPPQGVPGREPLKLGRTPLDGVTGAYVNDTVVLLNDDRGIRYEEVIQYGQPNQKYPIEKTFREATLKVRTRPALRDATVWRNNQKVGNANMPMKLFEGVQLLELRSNQLAQPVPFSVTLQPAGVLEQQVDVQDALDAAKPR